MKKRKLPLGISAGTSIELSSKDRYTDECVVLQVMRESGLFAEEKLKPKRLDLSEHESSVANQFQDFLEPVIHCDYCFGHMRHSIPIWGGLFDFPDGSELYVSRHKRDVVAYSGNLPPEVLPKVFEANVRYLSGKEEILERLEGGRKHELQYVGSPQLASQFDLMLAHARRHHSSPAHSQLLEEQEIPKGDG